MMAMAIFSLLALSMMRFFSASQQIYSSVTQRNNLYADARIALDMMNRELQAAKYNNSITPAEGIYPFWFEKMKNADSPNENSLTCPATYYNTDFYSNQGDPLAPLIPWQFELTQLNFIASTDMRPDTAESDVCELRYTFVPAGMYMEADTGKLITVLNGTDLDGIDKTMVLNNRPKVIREGWLVRCCTPDKYNNYVTATPGANPKWNFDSYPRVDSGGNNISYRIFKIWELDPSIPGTNKYSFGTPPVAAPPAPAPVTAIAYQKIIPYVYKLEFSCYTMFLTGTIDPTASKNVNGVGTLFTKEVKVWDKITVSGETRTVMAIASDTALTVDANFSNNPIDLAPTFTAPVLMKPLKILTATDNTGIWSSNPDLRQFGSTSLGTPLPDFVKIDLSILPPSDWQAWKAAIQREDYLAAQIIINKKLRTFSKIIYLDKKY
jgi:hypothetical protein